MTTIHNDGSILDHPFQAAGLGKAPFKFLGVQEKLYYPCKNMDGSPNTSVPPMPGGTCDYCGQAIRDCYAVQSSDGKVFDVGCDCIRKVGDNKLITVVESEKRKLDRKKRHARENAVIEVLQTEYDELKDRAKDMPHPQAGKPWAEGKTLFDYQEFVLNGSGTSGKIRNLKKFIEELKS